MKAADDARQRKPYHSPRRAEQAIATRRAVLDAARELFIEHGYAVTTVADIARRARVAVDTVYAMTVHKSQGSQFDTAAVLLPSSSSRILTRELLYTALTRARRELILVGTEDAVRRAVERPVARASGLRERLR